MKSFEKLIISGIYYKRIIGNRGTYVMNEDWDNLIILDACRYDMFKTLNNIKGKLEHRISRGSCTNEFLEQNFKGRIFRDTVYITANPLVNYHVSKSFVETVPVWKEGWSDELETVLPEKMVDSTNITNEKYPQKRLIVHFMQPHYPFIGEKSRQRIGEHSGILSRSLFVAEKIGGDKTQKVWDKLSEGKLKKTTVWEAYEENLQIVLNYAKKLVDTLVGKTVISSDHGNLFGEWLLPFPIKGYGHPGRIYAKNLVKVPWLIIENGERKIITESEVNVTNEDYKEDEIREKLIALGYLD